MLAWVNAIVALATVVLKADVPVTARAPLSVILPAAAAARLWVTVEALKFKAALLVRVASYTLASWTLVTLVSTAFAVSPKLSPATTPPLVTFSVVALTLFALPLASRMPLPAAAVSVTLPVPALA